MLTNVQVVPGSTSVARFDEVLVWFETGPRGGGVMLTQLLQAAQGVASGSVPPRQLGARLAAVLNTGDATAVPALVAATPEGNGLRVVVHGWGAVAAEGVHVPNGWVDEVITGRRAFFLGRNTVTPVAPVERSPFDLEDGVVPGDGVSFALALAPARATAAAPEAAAPPAPPVAPAPPPPAGAAPPVEPPAYEPPPSDPPAPDPGGPRKRLVTRPAPTPEAAADPPRPAPITWPPPGVAPPPAPVAPVAPPAPAAPVEPTEAVAPVEAIAPVAAVEPIEPLAPVEPVEPIEAIAPVAAVEPIEPLAPVAPVAPLEPVEPFDAVAPVDPLAPVTSPEPLAPVAPVEPVAVLRPHEPVLPVAIVPAGVAAEPPAPAWTAPDAAPPGRLVLDDGSTAVLERTCVLGRAPHGSPAVQAGEATPLTVHGDGIAPVHLEIIVERGRVAVRDLGTATTYLLAPGSSSWTRLAAGEAAPLTPGTRIALGPRTVAYEQA